MWEAKRHVSRIIAIVSLLVGGGVLAQTVLTPAEVRIALEKDTITQHEPVIVDIEIQNPQSTSLDFDPGYNWENVQINVIDPNGRSWSRPDTALQQGMKFSKAVHVDAGMKSTISIVANDWFNFDARGSYQLEVVLRGVHIPPSGISAKLLLQVEPRDGAALKAACSALLVRANNPQSFSASLVAAKALSEVNDSAAVPYMAAAMNRPEFVSLMIGGLARLNTKDAINALVEASKSRDPETSSLARSALAVLRPVKGR